MNQAIQSVTAGPKGTPEQREALIEESSRLFQAKLYFLLRGFGARHHDAEDILQKLWLYVWKEYADDKICEFGCLAWKARRLFLDAVGKEGRRRRLDESEEYIPPVEWSRHLSLDEQTLERMIWGFLPSTSGLTDIEKKVIWQRLRYRRPYSEMKKELGVASSTAADLVQRAIPLIEKDLQMKVDL